MAIAGAKHGLRGRGSFNVGMTFDGDWMRLQQLVNSQTAYIAAGATAGQAAFANKYKKEVVSNINDGGTRLGFPPNAPKYASFKAGQGGGSTPMMWNKTMRDSVTVLYNAASNFLMVGIPKGITRAKYHDNDNNKLKVHEYANVLENKYPRRPVFAESFKRVGGKKGLAAMVLEHIQLAYFAAGFKTHKI